MFEEREKIRKRENEIKWMKKKLISWLKIRGLKQTRYIFMPRGEDLNIYEII